MDRIELAEAKKRLAELVERANRGEKIGITQGEELAAMLVSPRSEAARIFDEIEQIRKRARKPRKLNVKDLIEDGRV